MSQLNLISAVRYYIDKIISDSRLEGMKVLLLDSETTQVISMVYSQSQIMEKEIYLVELIGSKKERMLHMKAAVFIQPSIDSVGALCREISNPRFSEYHIFFSNVMHQDLLQQLASADSDHEVIRQVQEYYADYCPINETFFSGINASFTNNRNRPSLGRNVKTILSLLLSLKKKPSAIRYASCSLMARKVATEASSQIAGDGIFDFRRQEGPLLLVLDRIDDPVTPLLNQWTYQAMVHELLGLHNNRCSLKNVPGIRIDLEDIVLSCTQDEFFSNNRYSNFGDLGAAVKGLMEDYQKLSKLNEKIRSIEDMQAFLERYPAFKSQSFSVSKHVAVLSELARIVEVNKLLDVSQVEQELACNEDFSNHQKILFEKLGNPSIGSKEKLRLAMLFALRYESSINFNLRNLKNKLINGGATLEQTELVDALLHYAGKEKRTPELLYEKGTLMSKLGKTFTSTLQGVQNVYAQHVPAIMTVIEQAFKGRLKEKDFPFTSLLNEQTKPQEIILYIVGGVTFEEAAKVAEYNLHAPNSSVILGGTFVHNSSSFMEELSTSTWISQGIPPLEVGF